MNFYNDNDPKACAWLRELISGGHIPPGKVDGRSILDIQPEDLNEFDQCHFFAGIGGWPLAFQYAGWGGRRGIWSASCPCPPFSAAGKKKLCPACEGKPIPHPLKTGIFACVHCGHEWFADGRHLYPELHRLITVCRPSIVVGEQVAEADGLIWLTGVRAALESIGMSVGASDLCAAGIAAPHRRQRFYWMAVASGGEWQAGGGGHAGEARARFKNGTDADRRRGERHWRDATTENASVGTFGVGISGSTRGGRDARTILGAEGKGESERIIVGYQSDEPLPPSSNGRMGDAEGRGCGIERDVAFAGRGGHLERASGTRLECMADADEQHGDRAGFGAGTDSRERQGTAGLCGFWDHFDVLPCRDGKARRVESGTFPLAHGIPGRVGLLRGYGNAIVPPLAATFLACCGDELESLT